MNKPVKFKLLFLFLAGMLWPGFMNGTIFEVDKYFYQTIGNGEVAITFRGNSYDQYADEYSGVVVIPSSVKYLNAEYKVTTINNNAFRDCSKVTTVVIPSSIKSIGSYAFSGCKALKSVNIPNGITKINDYSFNGCIELKSLKLPESIVTIGEGAFQSAGFSSINLGDSLSYIGNYAFRWANLSSVTIPASIDSIGNDAFAIMNNYNPVDVTFNAVNCKKVGDIYKDKYQILKVYGIFDRTFISNITIGEQVTKIPDCFLYADGFFRQNIKEIKLPNSIVSIGRFAFNACDLTSISIPGSVEYIGGDAFFKCGDLKSINFEDGEKPLTLAYNSQTNYGTGVYGEQMFSCCPLESLYVGRDLKFEGTMSDQLPFNGQTSIRSVIFGDKVTTIESQMLYGCTALDNIIIPNSVTTIGGSAFGHCTALKTLRLSDNLSIIGDYAFYKCSGLETITFPNSLLSIGSEAFSGCTGLKSLTFNKELTTIGENAFKGCAGLNGAITITENVKTIGGGAFYECNGINELVFNAKNCEECGGFPNSIKNLTIGDNVESIPDHAFATLDSITTATIPESVVYIGDNIFNQRSITNLTFNAVSCQIKPIYRRTFPESLTSVTFGKNVKIIPDYMFYQCPEICNVIILGSLTEIGERAFFNCSNLKSIAFPNTITKIGESAFYGCSALKSITIPNSVSVLGESAFSNCKGITYLSIGSGVNSIVDCFSPFNNIEELVLEDSDEPIEIKSYDYVWMVSKAYIGRNIIDNYFSFTGRLKSVGIGKNVTKIQKHLFDSCPNLDSIHISDINTWCNIELEYPIYSEHDLYLNGELVENIEITAPLLKINENVFTCCRSLKSIIIPNSVTEIGDHAFDRCQSLKSVKMPCDLESIGSYAFQYTALTEITLPEKLKKIGDGAFENSTSIRNVYSKNTIPPSCYSNTFDKTVKKEATLHVPHGSIRSYKDNYNWSEFYNIIDDIEVSGIEDIIVDSSKEISVYNLNGMLVYSGLLSDAKLQPGVYIVHQEDRVHKIYIK